MIINLFKATTGSLKIGNLSIAKRSKAITANVIITPLTNNLKS